MSCTAMANCVSQQLFQFLCGSDNVVALSWPEIFGKSPAAKVYKTAAFAILDGDAAVFLFRECNIGIRWQSAQDVLELWHQPSCFRACVRYRALAVALICTSRSRQEMTA